jgi:hypothetical protein
VSETGLARGACSRSTCRGIQPSLQAHFRARLPGPIVRFTLAGKGEPRRWDRLPLRDGRIAYPWRLPRRRNRVPRRAVPPSRTCFLSVSRAHRMSCPVVDSCIR